MAPLVPIFATEDLPSRVQIIHRGFKEKQRKGEPIDLHKCELMELVQYSCNPPEEGILAPGVVKCKPIVRLFRRFDFLSCFWGGDVRGMLICFFWLGVPVVLRLRRRVGRR